MKKKVAALGMAAAMLTGIAESVPAEEVTLRPILTMEQAQTMLRAASEEAKRGGHAVCISIVDRSGQTLAVRARRLHLHRGSFRADAGRSAPP